jgi:hypothetical protein
VRQSPRPTSSCHVTSKGFIPGQPGHRRLRAAPVATSAALDDAVDEVIERVVADGGEVFFYEPGTLDVHQSIAAVSRY